MRFTRPTPEEQVRLRSLEAVTLEWLRGLREAEPTARGASAQAIDAMRRVAGPTVRPRRRFQR